MILLVISLMDDPDYKEFLTNLYNEYSKNMFYYAYSILQDESLAEDAVNHAFMGIIKNVEKLFSENVNKMKPYIVVSVRNACYNIIKKQTRQSDKEILSDRIDEGIFEQKTEFGFDTETLSYVAEAVKNLKEQYRTVILLKYFHDYSYKEIAEAMDISTKHVGVLLTRAKAILKKEIIKRREEYEKEL